jgi:hypothetical protein
MYVPSQDYAFLNQGTEQNMLQLLNAKLMNKKCYDIKEPYNALPCALCIKLTKLTSTVTNYYYLNLQIERG